MIDAKTPPRAALVTPTMLKRALEDLLRSWDASGVLRHEVLVGQRWPGMSFDMLGKPRTETCFDIEVRPILARRDGGE